MLKTFGDSKGSSYSSVILNGKANYNVWAFTMKEHLTTAELYQFITHVKIEDTERGKAQAAKSMLISTISPGEMEKIIHCTSAKEIWDHFVSAYGAKTANVKLELMSELNKIKCSTAEEVTDAVNKILTIKGKLQGHGVNMDDTMVISALINALPEESYSTFLQTWSMFDLEYQTLSKFVSKLLERTKALTEIEETAKAFRAIQVSSHGQGRQNGQDDRFVRGNRSQNRAGNYRPIPNGQQPSMEAQRQPQAAAPRGSEAKICNYCRKPGHWKADCRKLRFKLEMQNQNALQAEEFAMVASMPGQSVDTESKKPLVTEWLVDSGCSSHMTPDTRILSDFKQFEDPVNIKIGDNSCLKAIGQGSVATTIGRLRRVLLVPKICSNLFSVSAASCQSDETRFVIDNMGIKMIRKDQEIFRAGRRSGTYVLRLQIMPPIDVALMATSLDDWHQRLGHLPKQLIVRMVREGTVDGLKIQDSNKTQCVDCALNKCKRSSHPPRTTPKSSKSGQSLHLDVVGPIRPEGRGNTRFILVCRDEFSRYRVVENLKAKSQVPETVKLFINRAEQETGNSVLSITSDNGTEFTSERLACFLQVKGIRHLLSAYYVPQQNGTSERENYSLLNQARTLLNSAKLPKEFWPDAISTATYTNNRCISKATMRTPYELWFGRKPNIGNLRVFGQLASVLKPDHQRAKFDEKGVLMRLIGYTDNYQTYKFLDPVSNKVLISCDAVFIGDTSQSTARMDFSGNGVTSAVEVRVDSETNQTDQNPLDNSKVVDVVEGEESEATGDHGVVEDTMPAEENTSEPEISDTSTMNATSPMVYESAGEQTPTKSSAEKTITNEAEDVQSSSHGYQVHFSRPNFFSKNTNKVNDSEITPQAAVGNEGETAPITEERSERRSRPVRDYRAMATGKWDLSSIEMAKVAQALEDAPRNYQDIASRKDCEEWYDAMDAEMDAMVQNEVFELVNKPNSNIVGARWVFCNKIAPDGSSKRKARLVAQGFTQKEGVDYTSTFAPVAQIEFIRLLFATAAVNRLSIVQVDIKTAFLNGDLKETIYMRQPIGYQDGTDRVWLLKKSIYGLKQAPKAWNEKFSAVLNRLGLVATNAENCVYFKRSPLILLAIYVDDAIIFSEDDAAAHQLISGMRQHFEVNIIESGKFLGFQYVQHPNGDITLHQMNYITSVLRKFGMWDCNEAPTPIVPGQNSDNNVNFEDNTQFREVVGALQYAVWQTRPDISFVVGLMGRKVTKPTMMDWKIVKRILRYLRGTLDLGLTYRHSTRNDLIAYSDADFAGDKETFRSTTGSVILFGDSPIMWKSKLQKSTTTSTTEAECIAASQTIKMIVSLKDFGEQLNIIEKKSVPLKRDNRGAVQIVSNEGSAQRTRHIGAQLYYAKEQHKMGTVQVEHTSGDSQLADILTKPLVQDRYLKLRSRLMTNNMSKTAKLTSMINLALCVCLALVPVTIHCANQTEMNKMKILKHVTLAPTNHYLQDGFKELKVVVEKRNHCEKWERSAKHSNEDSRTVILNKLLKICRETYAEKYLRSIDRLNIKDRMARGADFEVSQESCNTSHYPAWWSQIPLALTKGIPGYGNLFIGAYDIVEHFNPSSSQNTIYRNRDCIKALRTTVNAQAAILEKQTRFNDQIVSHMEEMMRRLNNSSSNLEQILDNMPELMHHVSEINIEIQRDADLLGEIRESFKRGQVNTVALSKVLNFRLARLDDYATADTKLLHFRETGNRLLFHFTVPKRDKNIRIYKLISFKEYLGDTQYREYRGPQFVFSNITNNCTKFTSNQIQVADNCTETNATANYYHEQLWRTMTINKTNQEEVWQPTIIDLDEYRAIQCYRHQITIANRTRECGANPFLVDKYTGFIIDNSHNYEYEAMNFTFDYVHSSGEINFTPSVLRDQWRRNMESVMEKLHDLKSTNGESNRVIKASFMQGIEQYDYELIIPISTCLAISVLGILTYCYAKKDPIQKILELKILNDLSRSISKSAPELNMDWQQPRLIRNPTQSVWFTPDATSQFVDDRQVQLYPALNEGLPRQGTPYPSAPSLISGSTSISGRQQPLLNTLIEKPNRFLFTRRAMSTVSVPADVFKLQIA